MSRNNLVRLTGARDDPCGEGDCANVYCTGRGTFVVQGSVYAGFAPPDGEALVEIPEEILREAYHALGW